MNLPFLIGGIDGGQIIGICVLVISVLSWFVNAIKGNNPDGVPREKKPAAKPQSGRSEIESLLKQLSGEKPKPQPQQKQQQKRQEQPQRAAKQQARDKPKPAPSRPTSAVSSISGSSRPMARPGEASMAQSNVGSAVRSHHLGNKVDAEVQRDVPAAFLNNFGHGIAPASAPQERQVHPLVKVLRDPNGVRNAILLNEILQRPKALRR